MSNRYVARCGQKCVWLVVYKKIENGRKFDFIEGTDKTAEVNSVEEIFCRFFGLENCRENLL